MPLICYRPKVFGEVALTAIAHANRIIRNLQDKGYDLTLRQIYYVFVSNDLFPDDRTWTQDPKTKKWFRDPKGTKNADPNYDWLGELLNDARLAGKVDWNAMVDRTRNLRGSTFWESPREIVETCISGFRMDPWERQPQYVEVWIEKDALIGVVEKAANQMRVPYFSCRGYTSQSEMWTAAQRLAEKADQRGSQAVVIHLGDHDPSGVQMTEDIQDRLVELSQAGDIHVERIALTMEQIKRFKPPPNPAKITDSRSGAYIERYGDKSWELDALDVEVMHDLIVRAVENFVDEDRWDEVMSEEKRGQDKIRKLAKKLD